MKKRKLWARILAIFLALLMIGGSAFYLVYIISPASSNVYALDAGDEEKIDNLKETIKTIEENYKDKVDASALIEAAYAGMFDALDKWSVYYSSSKARDEFTGSLANENYGGVGITLVSHDDKIYVYDLNPKGPAKAAGVQVGDIIIGVNGSGIKLLTIDDVANKLRGKQGTKVRIKVQRDDKVLNFTLTRKSLETFNVTAKIFDPETEKEITDLLVIKEKKNLIGYIRIDEFGEGVASAFETELQMFKAAGIERLVIDLRDNPGGYMDEALTCISSFLKKGDKLVSYTQQGKVIASETVPEDGQYKMKMALLTNEESASACDAFAAIFKDYKLGKIVGTTTYGKGVAQEIFDLGDGSFMKLTTCYFVSPKGSKIHEVGTKPDIEVKSEHTLTETAILKLEDVQLSKALELVNSMK